MAAALTRLIRRGNKPATRFLRPLATSPPQHGSRARLIDTFAPASSLRAQGLPSRHADVIVSTIFKVLEVASENVDQSFARKEDWQCRKFMFRPCNVRMRNAMVSWKDKILKLHHDVEMKIKEVKYDCISNCELRQGKR